MTRLVAAVYRHALRNRLRRLFGRATDPYLPLPDGVSLSPHAGYRAAYGAARRALAFEDHAHEPPEVWQAAARAKLAEIAGWPAERDPPAVTLDRPAPPPAPGIARRSVYLRVRPETDVPVHLLHGPDLAAPAPVYLHLAGSTSGVHVAWGEAKVPIDHQRIRDGADMGLRAARRGYLAVCIEQLGFGEREERLLRPRSPHRLTDAAHHALLLGRTLMGEKAWDVSAVLDWLLAGGAGVPVDPERVFLFGHSSGGATAQFCAALDERIRGVLASGSVGRIRDTIGARRDESGEMTLPGLLDWFEAEDWVALTAPRPFVALSGVRDHIFPFAGAERVVEAARAFYARTGAADRIAAVAAEGPHRYYAAESWAAWERFVDPPREG